MTDPVFYTAHQEANYDVFLENPLLFVLAGDQAQKYYRTLKQRFGSMGRCIFLQVIEDGDSIIEEEQVIKLRIEHGANDQYVPNCDSDFLKQLNEAIRRTKQYKYISGSQLAVCVLANQKSTYRYLQTLCETLYDHLTYAYLSRIVFDIYCFLAEEFVFEASSGIDNLFSMRRYAELSEKEWVRYVFLVSDVSSEEIITDSQDSIFDLALSSIALTNCNFGKRSISGQLRKDLSQEGQALDSKLLTIGGGSLLPRVDVVKLLLRRELLSRVNQTRVSADSLCQPVFEAASYYQEILRDVREECRYISKIYYYPPRGKGRFQHETNSKIMSYYFRTAPEQFMRQAEKVSQKRHLAKANDFFRVQIKPALDEALRRSGVSVCDQGAERVIANAAIQILSAIQKGEEEALELCKKALMTWKDQIKRRRFRDRLFHREDFIFTVLDEWKGYREQEIAHSAFIKFLSEIQGCVAGWQNTLTKKLELFSNAMQLSDQICYMMQNETGKVDHLLLNFYGQSLEKFFNANQGVVRSCRNDLGKLLERESDPADFEEVIQAWVERIYMENFQNVSPYGESTIFGMLPSQQDQLFEEMYLALTQQAQLQIRGSVPNIQPHICFFGSSDNKLIQYVQKQPGFQGFLALSDNCGGNIPFVLYYQNIASFEDIPAYQLYRDKYGDDTL